MIDLKEQVAPYIEKAKEFIRDEKNRSYVILGAVGLLGVFYLSFIIIPKFGDLSKTSRAASGLNNKISQLNSQVKRQKLTEKKLSELKAEYEAYSKRLPQEKEIPAFLEGLASIAKTSRVMISSMTPSELKKAEGGKKGGEYYREMPILITAKSGFHQLGKFISGLEQRGRFITVSNLSIKNDNNFPRMHNIRMELKTYVSVEEKKK
jgi:type IV pilus assembly protein PilO